MICPSQYWKNRHFFKTISHLKRLKQRKDSYLRICKFHTKILCEINRFFFKTNYSTPLLRVRVHPVVHMPLVGKHWFISFILWHFLSIAVLLDACSEYLCFSDQFKQYLCQLKVSLLTFIGGLLSNVVHVFWKSHFTV